MRQVLFDSRQPIRRLRVLPVAVHHNWGEPQDYKLARAAWAGLLCQRADLDSLVRNFTVALFGKREYRPLRKTQMTPATEAATWPGGST